MSRFFKAIALNFVKNVFEAENRDFDVKTG
jgi:hypothetical protein